MCPTVINRRSSRAVYRQLADILRDQMLSGRLRPGDTLPSADLLCRTFGVSMLTATRAFAVLREEGLIDTEPGRQAKVRIPPMRETVRLVRSATMIIRMPTARERDELGLREGVPVAEVEWGRPAERRKRVYPGDRYEFTTE